LKTRFSGVFLAYINVNYTPTQPADTPHPISTAV